MSEIGLMSPPSLSPRRLTVEQVDTLRLYEQLGTMAAVADFCGVSERAIAQRLERIRHRLHVRTTAQAVATLRERS